jgi:hypothetical protein
MINFLSAKNAYQSGKLLNVFQLYQLFWRKKKRVRNRINAVGSYTFLLPATNTAVSTEFPAGDIAHLMIH